MREGLQIVDRDADVRLFLQFPNGGSPKRRFFGVAQVKENGARQLGTRRGMIAIVDAAAWKHADPAMNATLSLRRTIRISRIPWPKDHDGGCGTSGDDISHKAV